MRFNQTSIKEYSDDYDIEYSLAEPKKGEDFIEEEFIEEERS